MDADTRDLLCGSIRDLLSTGEDVVSGLQQLGWSDVVDDDPAAATDLLFTELGRAGTASAALDTVVFARLADGRAVPLVHPVGAEWSARMAGGELVVDGVLFTEGADHCVAACRSAAYVVAADAADIQPVAGFDPESRLRRVTLRASLGSLTEVDVESSAMVAPAQRALAAELVGNAMAMLALAAEQISTRHQFGRPIGANQSPRHRLAEAYASVRGAADLVQMAGHTRSSADALSAKAYAGRASEVTSRACLQVCGAIGLTTEHALPRLVKRARILDAPYGGWQYSTRRIGERITGSCRLPESERI